MATRIMDALSVPHDCVALSRVCTSQDGFSAFKSAVTNNTLDSQDVKNMLAATTHLPLLNTYTRPVFRDIAIMLAGERVETTLTPELSFVAYGPAQTPESEQHLAKTLEVVRQVADVSLRDCRSVQVMEVTAEPGDTIWTLKHALAGLSVEDIQGLTDAMLDAMLPASTNFLRYMARDFPDILGVNEVDWLIVENIIEESFNKMSIFEARKQQMTVRRLVEMVK